MEIKEIQDKKIWEDFFRDLEHKTFLQSWNWGEVQRGLGQKIWRLGVYEGSLLVQVALATKISARRGTFLLLQHLTQNSDKVLKFLLTELIKIARQEKAAFIRIAPLWPRTQDNLKSFKELGFREAPMHASAYEATLKLDIIPEEDELLENMRKTSRYLVKQALKQTDIEIVKSVEFRDLEFYHRLALETAKRQRFSPFTQKLVRKEFEVFVRDNQAVLFLGKYMDEVVAACLVIFWSGIGFYHQAALSGKYQKLPVAYLLQWEAVKEAKSRGCKLYDFWGYVDPQKYSGHPWAGPSFFKAGFGGKVYEYVKTQDIPLLKRYWLTYVFEKIRSVKRGL